MNAIRAKLKPKDSNSSNVLSGSHSVYSTNRFMSNSHKKLTNREKKRSKDAYTAMWEAAARNSSRHDHALSLDSRGNGGGSVQNGNGGGSGNGDGSSFIPRAEGGYDNTLAKNFRLDKEDCFVYQQLDNSSRDPPDPTPTVQQLPTPGKIPRRGTSTIRSLSTLSLLLLFLFILSCFNQTFVAASSSLRKPSAAFSKLSKVFNSSTKQGNSFEGFLFDTGCIGNHTLCVNQAPKLANQEACNVGVTAALGHQASAKLRGDRTLSNGRNSLVLNGAILAPGMQRNLVSAPVLVDEGFTFYGTRDFILVFPPGTDIQTPNGVCFKFDRKKDGGWSFVPRCPSKTKANSLSSRDAIALRTLFQWHRNLGHLNFADVDA